MPQTTGLQDFDPEKQEHASRYEQETLSRVQKDLGVPQICSRKQGTETSKEPDAVR